MPAELAVGKQEVGDISQTSGHFHLPVVSPGSPHFEENVETRHSSVPADSSEAKENLCTSCYNLWPGSFTAMTAHLVP